MSAPPPKAPQLTPAASITESPANSALGPRQWTDSPSMLRVQPTSEPRRHFAEVPAPPATVLEAAMRRDAAAVLQLLAIPGADVNAVDPSGRTALLWCCEYSEGVRGRFKWASDETPPAAASGAGSAATGGAPGPFERCVEALLAAGADPTVQDNHGSTAVLLTAFRNSVYSLRCLLATENAAIRSKLEAFIEHPTKDGRTPLLWAVAAGSKECTCMLLELGADVQRVDSKEVSALMLACYEEGPNSADADQETMRNTDENGDEQTEQSLVQLLLSHGAGVDVSDCNGRSSLFYAVMGASRDAAFELLEHGAEASVADEHEVTPLLLAVDMGDDDMVRLLLSSEADVDATDAQGRTALSWACFSGFASTARLLLEAGASPLVQDERGMSPCMLAAFKGQFETVQELLDHCDDALLAQVLVQSSKDGRTPLLWAAASSSEPAAAFIINLLLSAGADGTKRTSQGSSALLLAAHKGNANAIVALIGAGADLSAVDAAGRNALHRAILSGRVDAVAALVAGGGAPLLQGQDKQGRTPGVLASCTHEAAAIEAYLANLQGSTRGMLKSVESIDSAVDDA
mmetsp:Transcript_23565/g.73958  ORF Transcript_23565/g.73958 Transcript_23565/m.73958 type:complete len:575 (-) Transcript_23565:322-2046(-)